MMYDNKHLVDAPMMKADDPKWIERQAAARTYVGRHAIDEADLDMLLEMMGLAA
jgi:hypothetical protein